MPFGIDRIAIHTQQGASMGEYFDCALPERYVEPRAECRYTRDTAGIFDTSYHAIVSLTGPDRLRYLNAVSTGNVKELRAGQGVRGLLLNPQGHILAELLTLAFDDRLLVLTHAQVRQRTAEHLEKFIIMDDVKLEDQTDAWGSLAIEGPAVALLAQKEFGLPLDEFSLCSHAEVAIANLRVTVIRSSFFGEPGLEFLVPLEQYGQLWTEVYRRVHSAGGGPLGYQALNAMRLEAGIPWFGYDFDDKFIPHEAGLEQSHISYTKGCYTGQEIVERVRSRGHVNRRLSRLQFLGLQVPPAGTKLMAGGQEAGHVTSAALSPLLGRVLGLGYVRREHLESGTMLSWYSGEVEVL